MIREIRSYQNPVARFSLSGRLPATAFHRELWLRSVLRVSSPIQSASDYTVFSAPRQGSTSRARHGRKLSAIT